MLRLPAPRRLPLVPAALALLALVLEVAVRAGYGLPTLIDHGGRVAILLARQWL